MWFRYRAYVPVATRQSNARSTIAQLAKKGHVCRPVNVEGRKIATSFWGKAWCDHLENHCDFENRLPRGRTYVRNGSVIDLQITAGSVTALVQGSDLYKIQVTFKPLKPSVWDQIKSECAGQIGSAIELLKGKLSDGVMRILTDPSKGMFPTPNEIDLDCSCPDWADMCKHVAAALYGVGNRLDTQPELLFTLRGVDLTELLAVAASGLAAPQAPTEGAIGEEDLSAVFGIEIDGQPAAPVAASAATPEPKAQTPAKSRKTAKRPPAKPPVVTKAARPKAAAAKSKAPSTKTTKTKAPAKAAKPKAIARPRKAAKPQ